MIANAYRSLRRPTTSDPLDRLHDSAGRLGVAAEAVGRDHPGHFGRIARFVTGRALAVLVCAALFGFHTPAHAQTEVWSATLTIGENSSVGFVFRAYDASHHSGSLSDDQFEHNGVTYTILILNHAVDGPLWFGTDATGADALGNQSLRFIPPNTTKAMRSRSRSRSYAPRI